MKKKRLNLPILTKKQKEIIKLILKENLTIKQIAIRRGISIQAVYKTIKKLRNKGILERISCGVFWLGTRDAKKPITNLHALQINIPILQGKIRDKEWLINEKLNNWIPKYKKLTILGGITLKNNNNNSITAFCHSRNIEDVEEVQNLAFRIRAYLYEFFKKQDVILDIFNCKTSNLNLATEDKEAQSMNRKGHKYTLDLNKKAGKIFEIDDINGKAWIDGSPFKFSAETNDIDWKKAYLSMPFNIYYIAQNYKNHVEIVVKVNKMLDLLIKRLNKNI